MSTEEIIKVVSPSFTSAQLYNAISNAEHIYSAIAGDGKTTVEAELELKGVYIEGNSAYLITDETSYFTDSATLIENVKKLANIFEKDITSYGIRISVSMQKTAKDKNVYRIKHLG